MSNSIRVSHLDSLRGVACILLVVFHIIGSDSAVGLGLPLDSPWSSFNVLFENLRMPLFAFLSGVVFSFRGLNKGEERVLLIGKFKRLYLPLICVGGAFLFVQANSGYSHVQVEAPGLGYYFSVLYYARFHYWFIHAIFLVFLFLVILSLTVGVSRKSLLYSFFISVFLSFYIPAGIQIFSFSGFIYLLPYFLLGSLLRLYGFELSKCLKAVLICSLLFALIGKYYMQSNYGGVGKISIYGYLIGFSGCATLYYSGLKSSFLAYIGRYSFTIFLFHVFFLAATRVALHYMGVNSIAVHVVVALFFTIAACIVVHKLFERYFILSWCFLGQRPVLKKLS